MLFTKALMNKSSNSYDYYDFEEDYRELAFESSIFEYEFNKLHCDSEHIAIEAYKDYNGNMSVLESQFEIIREEAEAGIWEKFKSWVKKIWEWIKKAISNVKNWIVGLFSKQQAFINKYKNDKTKVTANLIDWEDAEDEIEDHASVFTVLSKVLKTQLDQAQSGKIIEVSEDGNEVNYWMKVLNMPGGPYIQVHVENQQTYLAKSAIVDRVCAKKNKKERTVTMSEFVKDMEEFIKFKKTLNELSDGEKYFSKMYGIAEKITRAGSDSEKIARRFHVGFKLAVAILTGCIEAAKEVISYNMKAIHDSTRKESPEEAK